MRGPASLRVSPAFASGGGGGGSGGSALPGVGIVVGFVNLLSSLFGGSSWPPAYQQLSAGFSSVDDPIAGHTIEIDQIMGSPTPLFVTIPSTGPPGDTGMTLKDLIAMVFWSGPAVFLAGGGLHNFVSATNPSSSSGNSGGNETDVINVNNTFSPINNIDTSSIGTAIQSGISDVVASITQAQQQVTSQISSTVNSFGNSLFGWAKDLGKWIADNIGSVLSSIASKLKDVASAVYSTVKDAVTSVVKTLSDTVGPVIEKIGEDIGKVVDFYQQHIQPILQTISQVEQTVKGAIVAIQADLHAGITGLLNLPTDLANALSGIDQALVRAGVALRVKKLSDADVQWVGSDGKSITEHIKSLGDAVIGLSSQKYNTTYAPGKETLPEPDLANSLPKVFDGLNALAVGLAKGVWKILHNPVDTTEGVIAIAGGILADVFEPAEVGRLIWEVLRLSLDIPGELAAEEIRKILPLSKLDAGTLAQAWVRGLIDTPTMNAEMLVQGYDGNRSELLRRLTTYVPDANQLVDWHFRGVIDTATLHGGLHVLGWTDSDISALEAGSTALLGVTDALAAWRRGDIDEQTVNETFAANRYGEAERDLLKQLSLRPPNYREAYSAYLVTRVLGDYLSAQPQYDTIPQSVRDAGQAEGLSQEAVLAQWTGSIDTLSAQQWLTLYWRGQASLTQLQVALQRDRVPDAMVQDWIDSQRPTLPFRSIPTMVSAGILDESTALQKLQGIGYSLSDATLLLEYALRGPKKSTASHAAKQVDVSLTQAKLAYQDGLYTREQYLAILSAHGMDDTAAQLEVQLEDIQSETRQRKQIAADIVNEFQAGMIDETEAKQQLASSGLTLAEQAKAQRQMRSARANKAKLPSEAELRAMAVKNVISVDDYESNLVTAGYSTTWAAAFRQLHFPSS